MNRPFLAINQMGGGSETGLEDDCSVQRQLEQHVLLEFVGEGESSEAVREPFVKLQSDCFATSTGLEGGCSVDEHIQLPNLEDFLGVADHTEEGFFFSEAQRKPFYKLQSVHSATSTLESTDGSESNDITALTLGVVTMENIQDVGRTESGFEQTKQDSKSMANSKSFDILDRSWNIARSPQSRLDQRKHDLKLGPVPPESVSNSKFFERISRQNKLLHERTQNIKEKRKKLRRYRPGDWLVEAAGVGRTGFAIPEVMTLLVVGPSGAGKSTLINNMIRVLDNKTCGYDRAQVYEEEGNGSYFLQEYVVCEDAKNIAVFDSRGLSENHVAEDLANIRTWMTDGICHGEAVCRESDSKIVREALEGRGRQGHSQWSTKRKVNFVIFVVNAVSVHMMKETGDVLSKDNLAMLYKSPFLSFKDDRPAIVMTHGDQLSPSERIDTRIFIGEIFGVSPVDQVFDISCFTGRFVNCGDETPVDDLVLLDMLDFALERSDRNLPYKHPVALCFGNACAGIMEHSKELDRGLKTALLALFLIWFFCLALFIIVKCAGRRHDMNFSTRYFGAKGLLGWHKKW